MGKYYVSAFDKTKRKARDVSVPLTSTQYLSTGLQMICALNRTNSYNKSINKTGPTDLQHFSHLSSGSDKSNPRKKKLNLKHMKEYSDFAGASIR
jgi:hypothetical protein